MNLDEFKSKLLAVKRRDLGEIMSERTEQIITQTFRNYETEVRDKIVARVLPGHYDACATAKERDDARLADEALFEFDQACIRGLAYEREHNPAWTKEAAVKPLIAAAERCGYNSFEVPLYMNALVEGEIVTAVTIREVITNRRRIGRLDQCLLDQREVSIWPATFRKLFTPARVLDELEAAARRDEAESGKPYWGAPSPEPRD